MATLNQRLVALEQKTMRVCQNVFRIICAGEKPTAEEQAQIDEAEARGDFVICRLIVSPHIGDDAPEANGGLHGNA